MHQLQDALATIQVECKVAECEGTPCLFIILHSDESANNCCLKNQGVAIAETFNGH
nr:microcin ABC transporter permease [Candidatus Pantoea persica]